LARRGILSLFPQARDLLAGPIALSLQTLHFRDGSATLHIQVTELLEVKLKSPGGKTRGYRVQIGPEEL
jgi:hypothetical protein